jgi:hypothetical protein
MSALDAEFKDIAAASHWLYGPWELSSIKGLGPFTYFIQSGETIKIGYSNTPELRVDQLRRGGKAQKPTDGISPTIRLLTYIEGGQELERKLHARFAESRDCGEWFFITDELTALVNEMTEHQARRQVEVHNSYYQWAVKEHGWPEATFDLDAFTQKQVQSIRAGLRWDHMDYEEAA